MGLIRYLGSMSSPTTPGDFGDYAQLGALFTSSDIFKKYPSNPSINPMDDAIPYSPSANPYGWSAQSGNVNSDPSYPMLDPDTVVDADRGTVTRLQFPTGYPGGYAPLRLSGIGSFSTEGSDISVSSMVRSLYRADVVTAAPHGLVVGDCVRFSGATNSSGWNNYAVVSSATSVTFSYLLASYEGTLPTPATGTIVCRKVTAPTKLGVGFYVKLSSAWNDAGNAGTKLFFPRSPVGEAQRDRTSTSDPQGQNHLLGVSQAAFPNLLVPGFYLQEASWGNLMGPHGFARDVWHRVELYLQSNTGSSSNGVVRVWVTPEGGSTELWLDRSDILLHAGGSVHGWNSLYFDPTFGGGFNPVPADQEIRLDDFLIASAP